MPLNINVVYKAQAPRRQQFLQYLKFPPCPQVHVYNNFIRDLCIASQPAGEVYSLQAIHMSLQARRLNYNC